MKNLSGKMVLLTGASGGLGTYLAKAFAERGAELMLVAYPGVPMEEMKNTFQANGTRAVALVADLRLPEQRRLVVDEAMKQFGHIDVLVNNAGIEFTCAFDQLSEQNVLDVLNVNLEAPMMLTHMVLPDMLKRKSGFILNMSSLAGKSGPAYQEPYAASKSGLIAFTQSLRASYLGTGVSASVICPGFVEAGIYARLKASTGCAAPALLGTSPPEAVVRAVMRAIDNDLPEVIISKYPFRPLLAFIALFPRVGEWVIRQTGAHEFFGRIFAAQARANQK